MDDVYVYLINGLPAGVNELVTPCADGYTVYIDASLDDQHRLDAYNHALEHIRAGDFNADTVRTVQSMEANAHGLKPQPVKEIDIWANAEKIKGIPDDLTAWREARIAMLRRERKRLQKQLAKIQQRNKMLEEANFDFLSATERRWLEP